MDSMLFHNILSIAYKSCKTTNTQAIAIMAQCVNNAFIKAVAAEDDKSQDKVDKLLKGKWWMPWKREAMKDVLDCDKLWGAVKKL